MSNSYKYIHIHTHTYIFDDGTVWCGGCHTPYIGFLTVLRAFSDSTDRDLSGSRSQIHALLYTAEKLHEQSVSGPKTQ